VTSPAQARRERSRSEARRGILGAAEALLEAHGYEALSMRRVAARSGYALPTLYHHFGDKPGLLAALLDERFHELVAAVGAASGRGGPVAMLRGMLSGIVDFGLSSPRHYQLLIANLQRGVEPPAAQQARALIERPIRALLDAGRLRAGSVEVAVQAIWACAHGLISLRTSRADLEWQPDLIDVALDAILLGLVKSEPARPAGRRR
jgi:AcrR family transcriptional regulator